MSSPSIRVLLASPDRSLLRHLARFLHTFAYETSAISDASQAELRLSLEPPDILILDEDFQKGDPWSLCRAIRRGPVGCQTQIVALGEESSFADFAAPLEAGVDDFLAKPVDYGELLTRLRCCARRLEFERRLSQQAGVNGETGLLNEGRFWEKLRRERTEGGKMTCAMIEVDGFSAFAERYGTQAANAIGQAWAKLLLGTAPAAAILGDLGEGRFGAILPDLDESAAVAWRETVRGKAAAEAAEFGGRSWHLTASWAVLPYAENAASIEEFQQRLLSAIQTSVNSGGDCALLGHEIDRDLQAWTELAAPGKLFEHTTAGDIMTPCTVVLSEEDSLEQAAFWLERTHLPVLPVTDSAGKLRGTVGGAQVSAGGAEGQGAGTVKKFMCSEVVGFASDARMDTLRDYFALNASRYAIITEDGRPVGWVTPETMMALIRPIHRDSFASKAGFSRSSEFLRVGDLSAV